MTATIRQDDRKFWQHSFPSDLLIRILEPFPFYSFFLSKSRGKLGRKCNTNSLMKLIKDCIQASPHPLIAPAHTGEAKPRWNSDI